MSDDRWPRQDDEWEWWEVIAVLTLFSIGVAAVVMVLVSALMDAL